MRWWGVSVELRWKIRDKMWCWWQWKCRRCIEWSERYWHWQTTGFHSPLQFVPSFSSFTTMSGNKNSLFCNLPCNYEKGKILIILVIFLCNKTKFRFSKSTHIDKHSSLRQTSWNKTIPTPSVYLITQGGLGNQLFQYACSYALSRKYNIPLFLLLPEHAGPMTHRRYETLKKLTIK